MFAFFSASAHRWDVLISIAGTSAKRLSETRWSARSEAVSMIWNHYSKVLTVLEKLTAPDENSNTRADAGILLTAMQSFSFLCFLGLWKPVLIEVNDAQIYLQTKGLSIQQCAQKISDIM